MRYNLSGLEYYVYNKDIKGSTSNIVDNKNDKISKPDTLHLYDYCANNSINYVDPDGHRRKRISWSKASKFIKNIMNSKAVRVAKLVLSIIAIAHLAANIIYLVILLYPFITTYSFGVAILMILGNPRKAFNVCRYIKKVYSGITSIFTLKKKIKMVQRR